MLDKIRNCFKTGTEIKSSIQKLNESLIKLDFSIQKLNETLNEILKNGVKNEK